MASNSFFAAPTLAPLAAIFGDPHQALFAAKTLRQQGQRYGPAVVCYPDDPDISSKMQDKVLAVDRAPWLAVSLATAATGVATFFLFAAMVLAAAFVFDTSSVSSALLVFAIFAATSILTARLLRSGRDRSAVEMDVREALRDGHWAVVAHPRDRADRQAASQSLRQYGGEVL